MISDSTTRAGFTLMELLVVIAIIAILAALLLGSVSFVQARARSAECGSHLRQIGLGVLNYVNDNNTFPTTADPPWDVKIASYLGISGTTFAAPILKCPSDPRPLTDASGHFARSYALSKI